MDNDPAQTASSSRRFPVRFWPWLMVLLVVIFVGFIRFRLLDLPLERDEGEYAYAGQLILQGIPPYELAYNMKLPGTYFAYALGLAVFGQTTTGVHLTLLLANSLTLVFIFLLARKLFGVTAGLVACASYGIMSVSPAVCGTAAHANHFVVLFAVPATWLLWKAGESNRPATWFFSGLFYGLAFLMKQQGIWFCFFGWAFLAWQAIPKRAVTWLQFTQIGSAFGLGMVLPFGLACLYLASAGVFAQFWFWAFGYARYYVMSDDFGLGWQYLGQHLKRTAPVSIGFWLLAITALPLALRDRDRRRRASFAVFFWICSFLGTATGLIFREHYFILVLPALAMLVGLGVGSWRQVFQSATLKAMPLILFVAILGWNVWVQKELFFRLSPVQASQTIYPGNPFVESLVVAEYIREHSSPADRVAVLGSEPEIYFQAQRHSATGYIYTYPLMELQPYAVKMQHEMISEIESNQPACLVLVMYKTSWLIRRASDVTILHWFDAYTGAFYERVGVVGVRPTGETVGVWDADAGNFHDPLDQFIMIYRRRPDPATGPAHRR
jgi:4-amino-4-deoxy-L-arabinose transferase-like glycosyltransferase